MKLSALPASLSALSLLHLLTTLITVNAAVSPSALSAKQYLCLSNNVVCFTINEKDDDVIVNLDMDVSIGWFGLGIGESMRSADIWLMYPDSSNQSYNVTLSDRISGDNIEPVVDVSQDLRWLSSKYNATSKRINVVFSRRKNTTDVADFPIRVNEEMNWLWAVNTQRQSVNGKGVQAKLSQHTDHGTFTMVIGNVGDGQNQTISDMPVSQLVLAHVIPLFLAWMVFAPFFVLVKRHRLFTKYTRTFPVHKYGMFICVGLLSVAGTVPKVFHIEARLLGHFDDPHKIIGWFAVSILLPQFGLGLVIRKKNIAKLHSLLGRLMLLLGFTATATGIWDFVMNNNIFKESNFVKILVGLAIGGFVAVVVMGLRLELWRRDKHKENTQQTKEIDEKMDEFNIPTLDIVISEPSINEKDDDAITIDEDDFPVPEVVVGEPIVNNEKDDEVSEEVSEEPASDTTTNSLSLPATDISSISSLEAEETASAKSPD